MKRVRTLLARLRRPRQQITIVVNNPPAVGVERAVRNAVHRAGWQAQ